MLAHISASQKRNEELLKAVKGADDNAPKLVNIDDLDRIDGTEEVQTVTKSPAQYLRECKNKLRSKKQVTFTGAADRQKVRTMNIISRHTSMLVNTFLRLCRRSCKR